MSVKEIALSVPVEQPKHPRGGRHKSLGEVDFQALLKQGVSPVSNPRSKEHLGKRSALKGSQSAQSSPAKKSTGLSPELARLAVARTSLASRVLFVQLPKKLVDFEAITRKMARAPINPQDGQEGPTFILDDCVLKSTSAQEPAFNYFYSACSKGAFAVPKTESFNLATGLHSTANTTKAMPVGKTEAVSRNMQSIARNCNVELSDQRPVLMHAEFVSGTNLFDFARYTYKDLSEEERIHFFERLGAIAFLDLMSGQMDRLVPASYDESSGKYDLECGLANLGNILTDGRNICVIDNGIDPYLFGDADSRQESYQAFVQGLLKMELMELALSQRVSEELSQGINLNCDEDSWVKPLHGQHIKRNIVFGEFKPFLDDLADIGLSAMARGMADMRAHLKQNHVFIFTELSAHLDEVCPGMTGPLKKRFALL